MEGAPQRLFSVHHGVRVKGSRRVTIHFTGYNISWDAVFPFPGLSVPHDSVPPATFPQGPLWLSSFSVGQPWCLLLDCSGHQTGLPQDSCHAPSSPRHWQCPLSPGSFPESHVKEQWDSLPRATSAESQGRNDLVTGTKPFQAMCQKPHPQDQVG